MQNLEVVGINTRVLVVDEKRLERVQNARVQRNREKASVTGPTITDAFGSKHIQTSFSAQVRSPQLTLRRSDLARATDRLDQVERF